MTVKLREYGENAFEVTGLLHGREIVCIDYSGGKWTIGMSRNLPLELSAAREHIAVLNAAFNVEISRYGKAVLRRNRNASHCAVRSTGACHRRRHY